MDTCKKIVITDYKEFGDIPDKKTLVVMGDDSMEAQDGYHTFGELYEHRIALFIALCHQLPDDDTIYPWKSELHSDGTMFDGWFVAGIGIKKGEQITYHLPLKYWDKLKCVGFEKAPEWDGHTPEDVIERLGKLPI